MWLEVETKVRVKDPRSLRRKILRIAKLEKKEIRNDNYFAIERKKFGIKSYPKKAFRVREKSDRFEVNFKKWLRKYWDKDIVVKQEFEFSIKDKRDIDDLLSLFRDFGFKEWIKKIKTSESYTHKKDRRIVIEMNKIEHLGYFMEIEYLCQPNEMESAKKKIRRTLEELEINPKDIDNTSYTKMLWKKKIKN
jgi:predicted adenylyl cyclase CyaB